VEGVGIKGGVAPPATLLIGGVAPPATLLIGGVAPPATLLIASQFAGGFAPGRGVRITYQVIIYGLIIVINNFSEKRTPARGRSPPANCEAMSSVDGGATPPMSSVDGGATPMHKYTQTSTPSTNPYDSN